MAESIRKNRRGIRLAKRNLKRQLDSLGYARLRTDTRDGVMPGLRDRLLSIVRSLQEVRATDYGDGLCRDFLAAVTDTTYQSAGRWIDKEHPGLPDLVSFATICRALGTDPAWLLGLTSVRLPAVPTGSEWLQGLVADIGCAGDGLIGMRAEDDGMAPDIHRGDWVLVDTKDTVWDSGGRYVLALPDGESGDLDSRMPSLLFVDGDASTLNDLRMVFQIGYKVATAGEVTEAIGLLAAQHFDVILCDQRIPQAVREKLMQVAEQGAGGTVCILMIDSTDRQVIVDALNEPHPHRVVLKPWDDKNLRQVVDESILLARKLTQRTHRPTDDKRAEDSTHDEREVVQLLGRLHDQPALLGSLPIGTFGQQLEPTCVTILRNVVARAQGGFVVSASSTPQAAAVFDDAAHARALGIHTLGRAKLRISRTPV